MTKPPALRFLVPFDGKDHHAQTADALKLLEALHVRDGFSSATLLVGALNHLESGTILGDILGEARMKALRNDRKLRLGSGLVLEAHTKQTIQNTGAHEVVIALYAHDETMDIVDAIPGLRIAIAVPWVEKGVPRWEQTWNPPASIAASGAAPPVLPTPIQNSVVVDALKRLTSIVNLSTGLAHPSDKASAERTLWDLWQANQWVEPGLIRVWAVQNGWRPDDADKLMKLAEKTEKRKSAPRM